MKKNHKQLFGIAHKGLLISHFRGRWSQFIILIVIIVGMIIYLLKLCKCKKGTELPFGQNSPI